MIRRKTSGGIYLITQRDHAAISLELAEHWGNAQTESLPQQSQLLPAIAHHDDGWSEWESSPQIDPETGIPRDFLEMPLQISTRLWTHSVERCMLADPVGGCFVSLHFCDLATHALESREQDSEADPEEIRNLRLFLSDQETRRQSTLTPLTNSERTVAAIETESRWGFTWLQFFDRFSLWLCCDSFGGTRALPAPDGTEYACEFRSPFELTVDPWPFTQERLFLTAAARRFDQECWESDKSFRRDYHAASLSRLTWTLRSSS